MNRNVDSISWKKNREESRDVNSDQAVNDISIARFLRFMSVVMTAFTALSVNAYSQTGAWRMINIPQFNNIQSVAINSEGYIFLGQRDGFVLVSRDTGKSWQQANDSAFAYRGIGSLIIDSNGNLLVGTGTGFYVSTDDAARWTQENTGLNFPSPGDFYALAIDSGYVFASTGEGLFRTSNEGGNWSQLNVSPFYAGVVVNCFLNDQNGHLFAGTNAGLYTTSDFGSAWTKMDVGLPTTVNVRSLALDSTGDILAGTDSSVYESTNDGGSWTLLFTPKPKGYLTAYVNALSIASDGNLLAGTSSGFYLSADKGKSWTYVPVPIDSPIFVWSFATDRAGNIYSGTGTDGVLRSTDYGNTWSQLNTGVGYGSITALGSDPNGHVYAGNVGGVYVSLLRSTNAGGSWTFCSGLPRIHGDYPFIHALAAGKNGNVFAATDANGVLVSTDFGKDWSQAGSLKIETVFSLAVNSVGYVYAGTDSGVYESTDEGSSWSYVGLLGDDDILSLAVDSSGDVYAGTGHVGFGAPIAYSRIFRLSQSGGGWTDVYGNAAAADINSITVDSKGNVYAVTSRLSLANSSIIVRSQDNGATWAVDDSGITATYLNLVTIVADTGGSVFAGDVNNNGLFATTDGGQVWQEDSTGLGADNFITSLTANAGGDVFAGTNTGGVFENCGSSPVTSLIQPTVVQPKSFSLGQNYPNPFNPTTVISYKLSALSEVTLKVYDVLGREVATLVNGKQNAGSHTVTFDGSRLASGVYLYRLQAGSFVSVKKLVLLK